MAGSVSSFKVSAFKKQLTFMMAHLSSMYVGTITGLRTVVRTGVTGLPYLGGMVPSTVG